MIIDLTDFGLVLTVLGSSLRKLAPVTFPTAVYADDDALCVKYMYRRPPGPFGARLMGFAVDPNEHVIELVAKRKLRQPTIYLFTEWEGRRPFGPNEGYTSLPVKGSGDIPFEQWATWVRSYLVHDDYHRYSSFYDFESCSTLLTKWFTHAD